MSREDSMSREDDCYQAGVLLQFGLQPLIRPAQNQQYRRLIDQFEHRQDFRALVSAFAEGLGLQIVQASQYGLILAPAPGSVFTGSWSQYRSTYQNKPDNKLIDGLIHLAIMTIIFPRAEDLEEDPTVIRAQFRVTDVDDVLRRLCDAIEAELKTKQEADIDRSILGLYEAWRVYKNKPFVKDSMGDGTTSSTTKSMIQRALEFLQKQGCLTFRTEEGQRVYYPTTRYHTMVQEFSADALYKEVQSIINRSSNTEKE